MDTKFAKARLKQQMSNDDHSDNNFWHFIGQHPMLYNMGQHLVFWTVM